MNTRLNENESVYLNFYGDGTVRLGPHAHGIVWRPAVASVKVATKTIEATCSIYVGHDPTPDNFVDGTYTGSSGDSTDSFSEGTELDLNMFVWAVWTGGDPGSKATLTVTGTTIVGE